MAAAAFLAKLHAQLRRTTWRMSEQRGKRIPNHLDLNGVRQRPLRFALRRPKIEDEGADNARVDQKRGHRENRHGDTAPDHRRRVGRCAYWLLAHRNGNRCPVQAGAGLSPSLQSWRHRVCDRRKFTSKRLTRSMADRCRARTPELAFPEIRGKLVTCGQVSAGRGSRGRPTGHGSSARIRGSREPCRSLPNALEIERCACPRRQVY